VPDLNVIKMYKDLGGKIITIGSDSHNAENIGTYSLQTQEILKEIGFYFLRVFVGKNFLFLDFLIKHYQHLVVFQEIICNLQNNRSQIK